MRDSKILRFHTVDAAGVSQRKRTASMHDRHRNTTGRMMALMEGYAHWGPSYCHLMSDLGPEDGLREGWKSLRREASHYVVVLPVDSDRAAAPAAASPGLSMGFGLFARLRKLWGWLQRERTIARGIKDLGSLDDRTLRDLGIHRSEISHIVRHGLDETGRVRSPSS